MADSSFYPLVQNIDYTSVINNILSQLQDIDQNTDGVELTISSIDTSNASIVNNTQTIIQEVQNAVQELQEVDANTDQVEQQLIDILNALPNNPPSAQDIANAIVLAERSSVEGRVAKLTGTTSTFLSALDASITPGLRGNLISISDTGTGNAAFSIDGSAPTSGGSGPQLGEATGANLSAPIRNIDLSQVRIDPTSGASDITIYYEIYLTI